MNKEANLELVIPDSILTSFLEEEQAQQVAWEHEWWVSQIYPEYSENMEKVEDYYYGNCI